LHWLAARRKKKPSLLKLLRLRHLLLHLQHLPLRIRTQLHLLLKTRMLPHLLLHLPNPLRSNREVLFSLTRLG
jgi:hypothetical protein